MFYRIRYQTGELQEIVDEMMKGNIPCMDVDNVDEFNWVIEQLAQRNIYRVDDIAPDKNARDRIHEPEFEFRIAFASKPVKSTQLAKNEMMYIDFYFEPDPEETYDSIGEI